MSNMYDFAGWATKNDVLCSDGVVIRKNAFADNDGKTVPLVWMHQHNKPEAVIGHALLENRNDGVWSYCKLNESPGAKAAKAALVNGDIDSLSIFANRLKKSGNNVMHGCIKEVSLVLAGANSGAKIEEIVCHSDDGLLEAQIYNEPGDLVIFHEDDYDKENDTMEEKTVQDVLDELTDEQRNVVYALIGLAAEQGSGDQGAIAQSDNFYDEGDFAMNYNLFDQQAMEPETTLTHADIEACFADAKTFGSLRDSVLAHGIDGIEWLFPEAKALNNGAPEFYAPKDDWVKKVLNGVHHTPFSRIKSMYANLTEDEARARGYLATYDRSRTDNGSVGALKGKVKDGTFSRQLKKEEYFNLIKRTTTPTTIYKSQSIDRDDVIDITDFDVVAWIKGEMRQMLDMEIARAILIGDQRLASDEHKISELNIRPIWTDDGTATTSHATSINNFYTINRTIVLDANDTEDTVAKKVMKTIVKARKEYRGTGTPTLYCTEDLLTNMLLLEDNMGRIIYESIDKLKNFLRVSDIVTVPPMENAKRTLSGETKERQLYALVVNLNDYNVGADKGGAVNMFDDFDIDYNAQKYLIETRCSGALVVPKSAIAVEVKEAEPTPGSGGAEGADGGDNG